MYKKAIECESPVVYNIYVLLRFVFVARML